ncbi:MAG: sulfite exporter TauE/SafE family protein [Rhodospirillaceae bacterium]|jgi:uncharacterized protein|nr:sulfite exporter TauE/SafE family protein [Rhodospirillaceae bacterium]MBT4219410.1 sulfite exporter TauE/SafE family protein [Rhodospirillaceae bacterium]MBT4487338.1 sulfite exporter TauE/SafE family protein [Rhodospirillaceae bacterium]MBT5012995.1 sulfite exporter TauE/SafE family protein [Rhodospirillaceae bacterium]MBT5309452.1 sulfite exporter TauE/SafE family protein [Rhodospirillaceae bacterium]
MTDEVLSYVLMLAVIGLASYVQAVIGFGIALIVISVVASLDLMPIGDAAVIITMIAMANTSTSLLKNRSAVRWREAGVSLVFSLPAIALGLYMLNVLSGEHLAVLRIVLGVTILASALMLLKPPRTGAMISGLPSFAVFGVLSGILSGMFSTGGPPVVFQFYRQPLSLPVIRDSLLALFLVGSTARTVMVAATDGIETRLLILTAISLPLVVVFSMLGRKYPPRVSELRLRQMVFALLALTSVSLMVP